MAIDEVLLESVIAGEAPVLRLYGFNPTAVSLGLNQKLSTELEQAAAQAKIDLVRRPTGGRAVLHHNELTYSFCAGEQGQFKHGVLLPSVAKAYRQICAGLEEAFALLGVKAELGQSSASYRQVEDCFLATTNADLHVGGKKLVGSAQLRRKGAVLQHGSILLNQDQDEMPKLLGQKSAPGERHLNLFTLLGKELPLSTLENAMEQGFARAFKVKFESLPLRPQELERAAELAPNFKV